MNSKNLNITTIGAGNLASHLTMALLGHGHTIDCVFSRNIHKATTLSRKCNAFAVSQIADLPLNSDIYFICISDDAIEEVAKKLPLVRGLIVHTSGSQPMDVLSGFSKRGVFYPLQSFSESREADFSHIPICIESSTEDDLQLLLKLAGTMSSDVRQINSLQRKHIHLAAVFACNFSNYMYSIANDILKADGISFDILNPLILECASKALDLNPREAQTGPAKRNDQNIIQHHLELLNNLPDYREIYEILSRQIKDNFHTKT